MKILKRISILLIALFFICNKTIAQSQSLTIENSTVALDNVNILDSLLAGNGGAAKNQVLHRADFEIIITSGNECLKVITELQASLINNKYLNPELNLPVSNGADRSNKHIYKNAVVRKIVFDELNASLSNYAKIIVTIEAASIEVTENVFTDRPERNIKAALVSNYRIKLGSLPCDRIAKISEMQIGSGSGLPTATVKLSGADEKIWNEQFSNGANKMITDGTVEILSADLKTVILSFNLKTSLLFPTK
ncbi:MAG: hypothetical protein IPI78_11105 [Chitinophagaceae bacterium]|nr:hypothetical protein [Chitinophagaceae bacterium]